MPIPPHDIHTAPHVDFESLYLFAAVVRTGSVSKGAQAVRISQPSATVRLRKLERQVGFPLLQRSAAGSSPTAAGVQLLEAAQPAFDALRDLDRQLIQLRPTDVERWAIVASFTIGEYLLPRWLKDVRGSSEGSAYDLTVTSSFHACDLVTTRQYQLGFVECLSPPSPLQYRVVDQDRLGMYVNSEHPWAGSMRVVAPKDLLTEGSQVKVCGAATQEAFQTTFRDRGLPEPPVFVTGSTTAAKQSVIANGGVLVSSSSITAAELKAGLLHEIQLEDMRMTRPFSAVWLGTLPEPLEELIESICEYTGG